MSEGKEKKKFRLTLLIIFLVLLICAVGVFVLYKKGILFGDGTNSKYEFVKVFETEGKVENVFKTENHYLIKMYDENSKEYYTVLNKGGKDVTFDLFGVNQLISVSGTNMPRGTFEEMSKDDRWIIETEDQKYGIYDFEFNTLLKIEKQAFIETDNYLYVADSYIHGAELEIEGNVGVYNKNLELIIPSVYESIHLSNMYIGNSDYDTDKTYFFAKKDGKYGVIDDKNNVIVSFLYDSYRWTLDSETPAAEYSPDFGEIFKKDGKNYFILYQNEKFGMVDENDKIVISFDKSRLFYDKNAEAVIELIYGEGELNKIDKINVYDLNGMLKKTINLNNDFKATNRANFYKTGEMSLIFYDNDFIYILNKNLEYDKYNLPTYRYDDRMYAIYDFYASDTIYLRDVDKNNGKVKIYKTSDNSLFMDQEFYFDADNNFTRSIAKNNGLLLCKNKLDENNYSECGIIGYDGNIVIDFTYKFDGSEMFNNERGYVDYDLSKYKIQGDCTSNKTFNVNNNIITVNTDNIDDDYYTLNCVKLPTVLDYQFSDSNKVLTRQDDGNDKAIYEIHDIVTNEIDVVNNDVNVNSEPFGYSLTGERFFSNDSGVYIIKY